MTNQDEWITTREAAELLDVSRTWITILINQGRLTARKLNPRMYLVKRSDVEAYAMAPTRKPHDKRHTSGNSPKLS